MRTNLFTILSVFVFALGLKAQNFISSSNTLICAGESVTLTANHDFLHNWFLWSNGATTSTLGALNSGTYTVTVSLANNCTTTAQTLVVVNPTPTVSLNCPAICAGIPTDITATPSPAGTYTYSWTVLPGGVTDPENSATVSTSTAGPYTVSATNTTTNCPSAATSCTIAVQNQPSINAISPP
jgi:hypothetical protein